MMRSALGGIRDDPPFESVSLHYTLKSFLFRSSPYSDVRSPNESRGIEHLP